MVKKGELIVLLGIFSIHFLDKEKREMPRKKAVKIFLAMRSMRSKLEQVFFTLTELILQHSENMSLLFQYPLLLFQSFILKLEQLELFCEK